MKKKGTVKFHTSVKITAKMLRNNNACEPSMKVLRPLLPISLSTDPEKNLELTFLLIEAYGKYESSANGCNCKECRPPGGFTAEQRIYKDLAWLQFCDAVITYVIDDAEVPIDAGLIAQHMAAVADVMVTEEGK